MTITINPFDVLRAVFIFGWATLAGIVTFSTLLTRNEMADYVWLTVIWTLCFGSALMLYLGR